jgi:ribosomal protein L16 Arg81 hydroxylase
VYETVLEPGDILFIPEGWAHQALNLEWTAMVSSNYVDTNNFPNVLELMNYDQVSVHC